MNLIGIHRRLALGAVSLLLGVFGMASLAKAGDYTVTNLAGDQTEGSLAWAIESGRDNQDADQITFAPNLTGTINLTADLPSISSPMTIQGPGKDKITVDGGDVYSLFLFLRPAKLSGLTLANGGSDLGGGVDTTKPLELDDVHITGNDASGVGAIAVEEGGSLVLKDSEVTGNLSSDYGALWAENADVSVSNTKFTGNKATGEDSYGGALSLEGGKLTLTGSEISGNEAAQGGGLYFGPADVPDEVPDQVTITGTKFTQNSATKESQIDNFGGGGASINADQTTVTGSEFSDNQAVASSAGLGIRGSATVTSTLIADNDAPVAAGLALSTATPLVKPEFSVVSSTITGNKSIGGGGGGIFVSFGNLHLESSTISGNSVSVPTYPDMTGAGLVQIAGKATLVNSIVSANTPDDLSEVTELPDVPPLPDPGVIEGSYSLVGAFSTGEMGDTVAGTNISATDPKLGPLADNGGEMRTMLPAEGSPVIDQGLSTLPSDQRGATRTIDNVTIANPAGGNGTDIGAVEVQDPGVIVAPPPPNKFSFGWYRVNRKSGVASLQVTVPGKGKLVVVGSKTVAKSTATAKGAATVVVKIKAKGKAAKTLRKKGKVKVKATVKFTPTGGSAKAKAKTIKLAKAKKKKKRRK